MQDNRRFKRGSGVYKCLVCGKQTRETGLSESNAELCAFCFEEGGLENSLTDGHITQEQFEDELKQLKLQYRR